MRWSQSFIPTLRNDPADAEAASHRLLIRGGFVRQLAAGHYSLLPLGQRVRLKIMQIIREEMNRIGGQEFTLPAMHPAEIWRRSGRWDLMGEELFRLKDRKEADHALGMTHEEVFATLATELTSYRELPQIWYQIQIKFRDEPRPKSGVLRVREFTMKDSYSFDLDRAGLDVAFDLHHDAYLRIFRRCGLEPVDVAASSGAMGGSESMEFMVPSPAGEDWVVTCSNCDYRANLERATSYITNPVDGDHPGPPEEFPTPGIKTIAALAEAFPGEAAPERQIKTLVYMVDGHPTLVLLRGDHDLLEQKLIDVLGTASVRAAQPEEIRHHLGASPGSLGAVGVTHLPVIADMALENRREMVTGANRDGYHLRLVDVSRDMTVERWADLRAVKAGEPCPRCQSRLEIWKGIEVGHIFKLGTKFSESFEALVQDEAGNSHPIVMGSYGIGVERTMAAIAEWSHDEKGIVWPVSVAPFDVVITVLRTDNPDVVEMAEKLYGALTEAGIDTIIDDRDERPGVKFADAELIGIPHRLTVGPKGVTARTVEWTVRKDLSTSVLPLDSAVFSVSRAVQSER